MAPMGGEQKSASLMNFKVQFGLKDTFPEIKLLALYTQPCYLTECSSIYLVQGKLSASPDFEHFLLPWILWTRTCTWPRNCSAYSEMQNLGRKIFLFHVLKQMKGMQFSCSSKQHFLYWFIIWCTTQDSIVVCNQQFPLQLLPTSCPDIE